LRDQLIEADFKVFDSPNPEALKHTQDFFNKNFLNRLCIKSTFYGDSNIAEKEAYRQARELINYFRYTICLLSCDKISIPRIRINLLSESYGNFEKTLIRRYKDEAIVLISGRGHKSLENFCIDKDRLEDLSLNGFLEDFSIIINSSCQTQLDGCILTAIYWIGEAQNEVDLDVSFLKYWTALECIFTGSEQPTHALAKGVATLNAFSGYELIKLEDAKEVYKGMTKLYDKRSDIIHRGMNYLANQVIDNADITKVNKYTACSIHSLFYLRSIGYTSMDEVSKQINRLYLQWSL
jgi:hypothetical protein